MAGGRLKFRIGIFAAAGLAAGCASSGGAVSSGYCAPPAGIPSFAMDPSPPRGSSREEFMAALVGLRSVLADDAHDEPSRLFALERVEEARLAIAATSAELDCEAKRAGQAADALSHRQSSTVQALTIASIATAAVTGLASVFASTTDASAWTQNGIAIGGGAVTAGFGLASLYVQPSIAFHHSHNMLADIWNGPARSSAYPPVVWGYLSRPEFSNDQSAPIRVKLIQRWRHFQHVDDSAATVALLFGSGGKYDLDTLQLRTAMLEQVKAEVELGNQELAALSARLHRR